MSKSKPLIYDTVQLTKLSIEVQQQLAAITQIFADCPLVQLLMLFGSYARGDFVNDLKTGYHSDFDLLVVTHTNKDAADHKVFNELENKAQKIAGSTIISLIRHDIAELNYQIRAGQFFFVDIVRDGIVLYDSRQVILAKPKANTPKEHFELIQRYFKTWFASATSLWTVAHYLPFSQRRLGAFLLHQATERYLHTITLVFEGYKHKTHNLSILAGHAEKHHQLLQPTLVRSEAHDEHIFKLLKRAYVEARYVMSYDVTRDELEDMRARVCDLAKRARVACIEKLSSYFGADALDELPDISENIDLNDLPTPPEDKDDKEAFELWQQVVKRFLVDRINISREHALAEGKADGLHEGQAQERARAIIDVLKRRNVAISDDIEKQILACRDADLLAKYWKRAFVVNVIKELLVE
ncbi:MAG: HEPN domain-containing protein [Deltaproteobacteria bacterium]|nr:HEPN domain-containing protein [Deltaproteobacteria bacterium]